MAINFGELLYIQNVAVQDARELLSEVREMKFALDESDQAAEHLTSELSAVQVCLGLSQILR